ncbi:MAG: amidoligase family protein [Lentisphaerota bacterium]
MNMNEIKFGIEIETVGLSQADAARTIKTVTGGTLYSTSVRTPDGRVWQAVRDGSLPGVHAEIVSPILKYADIDQLQEIVRALREAGAKAHSAAGIHIHIEAAPFSAAQLANVAKMIYKQENLLIHALGISHARLQRYTKPVSSQFIEAITNRKPKTKADLARAWYGDNSNHNNHYDPSRYHILNLHAAFTGPTWELRAFESTMHAGKIKAYIQLALAIAIKALNSKSTSAEKREFNAESAKYDLRVWLLGLGMIGDEFKTARFHLLNNMPGDASFKTAAQRAAHNSRRAA